MVIGTITIASIFIIVAVALSLTNNTSNDEAVQNSTEFHELVEYNENYVFSLLSFVENIYEGGVPVASFKLDESDYEETKANLENGMVGLENINERLQLGLTLSGTKDEINLAENLYGLKEALARDLDKYRTIVDFSIKLLELMQDPQGPSIAELQEEYSVNDLIELIEGYTNQQEYIINELDAQDCSRQESGNRCDDLIMMMLRNEDVLDNSEIIQETYQTLVNDLVYSGEGSVEYYLTNLYVGTEDDEED